MQKWFSLTPREEEGAGVRAGKERAGRFVLPHVFEATAGVHLVHSEWKMGR